MEGFPPPDTAVLVRFQESNVKVQFREGLVAWVMFPAASKLKEEPSVEVVGKPAVSKLVTTAGLFPTVTELRFPAPSYPYVVIGLVPSWAVFSRFCPS